MVDWTQRAQDGVTFGSLVGEGYGSQVDIVFRMRHSDMLPEFLNQLLRVSGSGATAISLILLGGLGAWVYRFRRVDVWLLIGVSAVIARLWTYHRTYDDLLKPVTYDESSEAR